MAIQVIITIEITSSSVEMSLELPTYYTPPAANGVAF